MTAELPEFICEENEEVETFLNESITEDIRLKVEELIDRVDALTDDDNLEAVVTYETVGLTTHYAIIVVKTEIVTDEGTKVNYSAYTADLQQKKLITLSDILDEHGLDGLNTEVRDIVNEELSLALGEEDMPVTESTVFFLEKDYLVLLYDTGALGDASAGGIAIRIPLEGLALAETPEELPEADDPYAPEFADTAIGFEIKPEEDDPEEQETA